MHGFHVLCVDKVKLRGIFSVTRPRLQGKARHGGPIRRGEKKGQVHFEVLHDFQIVVLHSCKLHFFLRLALVSVKGDFLKLEGAFLVNYDDFCGLLVSKSPATG